MSEAVAIISVSTSAIVGLAGLGSAVWGASRERRWKSREERTIDLRSVLEEASENFGKAMFACSQAWEEIARKKALSDERKTAVDDGWLGVVGAANRIGVRLGHGSAEHTAYRECMWKVHATRSVVAEAQIDGVNREHESDYLKAHEEAVAVETIYLDIAAKRLGPSD
jgi:hypothetical protein